MKHIEGLQVDKSVPIPLYYQLKTQLLSLIEDGAFKPGDALPAEHALCEQLDISRPTVRQALSELVDEGYLVRYKGKGTFIGRPKVKDRFLSKLQSFNAEMLEKGMLPQTDVLTLKKIPGNSVCNAQLELPEDEPLIYLKRVRYTDNEKVVFLETYIPYRMFPLLMQTDFTTESLYTSLESLYGVRVNRARREIEAVTLNQDDANLLGIPIHKAVCLVTSVAYAEQTNTPVEYSIARYRGDRTKFAVETLR